MIGIDGVIEMVSEQVKQVNKANFKFQLWGILLYSRIQFHSVYRIYTISLFHAGS